MGQVLAVAGRTEKSCERVLNPWREQIRWWHMQGRTHARRGGHHCTGQWRAGEWQVRQQRVYGTLRCQDCYRLGAVDSDGGAQQFTGLLFTKPCPARKRLDTVETEV